MISYVMDASLLINQAMELRLTPRFSWVVRGFHSSEFIKTPGSRPERILRDCGIRRFQTGPWTTLTVT